MFTKDSRTEGFLSQMGVSFRYSNSVTFAKLRPGWEEENIARPTPIRDEAVQEYAALMENGSAAPGPILARLESGLEVLDGVQRLAAAKLLGSSQLSAYIVDCDSENLLASIRVLSNARLQGRAEPAEWTRRRAVEILVVNRGMSPAEVALMGGWRAGDIERIAEAVAWNTTIQNVGGPKLPDNVLALLAKHTTQPAIQSAPEPITGFLHMLKRSSLSCCDAEPHIVEFFKPVKKRPDQSYAKRLEAFADDPEIQARVHGRRGFELSRDVSLSRTLKAALTIIEEIEAEGAELPYIDEFFKQLQTMTDKLHRLAKRHPKAESVRVPADMWANK